MKSSLFRFILIFLAFLPGCTATGTEKQARAYSPPPPVRMEIGEAGATLTLEDGTTLVVPPGTVRTGPYPGAGWIRVNPIPVDASLEEFPFTGPILGSIYEVSFENAELVAPLQVSFPLPVEVRPEEYEIAVYGYDPRHPTLEDTVLGVAAPPIWAPLPSTISGRRVTAWIDSPGWLGKGWTWKGGHASLGVRLDGSYPGGDLHLEVHGQVCVGRSTFQNRAAVEVGNRVTVLLDRSNSLGQAFNAPFLDMPLVEASRPVTVPRPEDPNTLFQCVPETFRFQIPLHQYITESDRQVNLYARFEIHLMGKKIPSSWYGRSPAYPVTVDRPGRLDVVPSSAPPAAPLWITGSAFLPHESVNLWWDLGSALAPVPLPVMADAGGSFSIALTAPQETSTTDRVRLVGQGQSSGWTSEAVVQVMRDAPPLMPGADPPSGSRPCLVLKPMDGDESRSLVFPSGLEESSRTVSFEVEDRCGRSNPQAWEIFPPHPAPLFGAPESPSPFGAVSIDPGGRLVVHLDSKHVPAGIYQKVIGLRYPGQIAQSLTFLQVQVIDQPYLLPSSWNETRQVTYRWGKNDETRGECPGTRTTTASGNPSARWVTEVVTTTWEGECARNSDMHTNTIDRLTGLEVSTTCFNCFPRHLGPQPADGQVLVAGNRIPVFTRQWPWYGRQEALTGVGFWESEGSFQVQYDAATGLYLDLTYQGKLYFTGGTEQHAHHGQWDSQQVILSQTDFPYGVLPTPPPDSPSCLPAVPNVQGRNAWEAGAFLQQAGYAFTWDTTELAGTVVRQDPQAGACSPSGQAVVRLSLRK